MVMFGGMRATDYKATSGIHILDTNTMVWKTGTPAPAQEARQAMACTVSGDYFIAWGGKYHLLFTESHTHTQTSCSLLDSWSIR